MSRSTSAVRFDGAPANQEPQSGALRNGCKVRREFRCECADVDVLSIGLDPPGFDTREVKQRINQSQQTHAALMCYLYEGAVVRQVLVVMFREDVLKGTEHQRQRRAKLMADIGEERSLGPVNFRQRIGALALLLVGVGVSEPEAI